MSEIAATLVLPFTACLLMTAVLGCLGLHVLKREVIFIDIAVAQVAALGAVAAHTAFHVHADSVIGSACAFGATLVAALFFALVRRKIAQLPIEATIGITYAIVAAAALFTIGRCTGGHTHVQQMLTGSLLWIDRRGVAWAAVAFTGAGLLLYSCRRSLQRISDDYEQAAADGLNVVAWDFLFYAVCGVVITAAVQLAGVVVVFCFLIVPATVSALFSGKWHIRLLIAWITGAAASALGLMFSQLLDFSAGVSVALFLGLILIALSIVSGLTRPRAGST